MLFKKISLVTKTSRHDLEFKVDIDKKMNDYGINQEKL